MNERIRELAAQSDKWSAEEYHRLFLANEYPDRQKLFNEKFAELIVWECIGQVEKDIEPELDDSDYAEHWNMALRSASNEIKNHFGVEE